MERKYTGILTAVSTGEYFFEPKKGSPFEVHISDESKVLFNKRVELCMQDTTVCMHKQNCVELPSNTPEVLGDLLDTRKKRHIGIFKQMPLNATESDMEHMLIITEDKAREVQDFYRFYASKDWDVQVRGFVYKSVGNTHPPYYDKTNVKAFKASGGTGSFDPNYHMVWGGTSSGYCGQAVRGGNWAVTYISSGCGVSTMIHELGHSFSLHHASALYSGGVSEYRDITSVMGSSKSRNGLNSVNLINLDLEAGRETKILEHTEQVLLCPIELPAESMHPQESQNAIFRLGKTYYLSIRKFIASHHSHGLVEGGLYIHEGTRDKHSILISKPLMPGESIEVATGRVEYVEYMEDKELARVNFYLNVNDPKPEDLPTPEGFPQDIPIATLQPKHSGVWHDKETVGQGYDIHIHNDRMLIFWYTYNFERDHSRRFYYGTCSIDEGIEEFDIYTTKNGTWENPETKEDVLIGRGQLYFTDDTNGVFNFRTDEHGRGSIKLSPVMLSAQHESNGSYWQDSRDGEGLTVRISEDNEFCSAYWYSYGLPVSRWSGSEKLNQDQRWYTCQGSKSGPGRYKLRMFEVRDGVFNSLAPIELIDVGPAILKIKNKDNISFKFSLNGQRVSGNGEYNLTRLF